MHDLARLLAQTPLPPAHTQPTALAWIDEAACIGCTACIRACPVDAIMGAAKQMHTVIAAECSGCGLCVAPCPVDCIHMQPLEADYLPQARFLSGRSEPRFAAAEHARHRYQWHTERKARDAAERKAYLAEREAATRQAAASAAPKAAFNPADLIAQAMSRAQTQQTRRSQTANRADWQAGQIEAAQARATYRRAQRDLQYGTETEKAAALEWLRAYKAEQEAKSPPLEKPAKKAV